MSIPPRAACLGLALLMTAGAGLAQSAPETQSVHVAGKRGAALDPKLVTAARSKVLSRRLASSCNYMAAYSAAEDELTQAYMSDMGLEDSMSNEAERFDENSPNGDVSTSAIAGTVETEPDPSTPSSAPAIGCGPNDRNFAAGRHHIARKDKSLAQAFAAFDMQDYAKAREQAGIAWNKIGYEEAALMLARLHLYGLGTPQNSALAIDWLEKVTLGRFDPSRDRIRFDPKEPELMTRRIEAMLLLARVYLRGMGRAKDPQLANKWYAKAAEIGFVPASNTLGMAALNGFGMPRSAVKAQAWFKEAAEAGYAPAQYKLARLYYLGDQGLPQDLKLAGAWFAAATKSGHAGALFAAGRMYDLGEGVAADPQKAIVYYKEAALKSNADAQSALATYFYTGEVVKKDLPIARKLFAAAARQGQSDAMFNLGVMTAKAEAGVKDMAMAYVWLSLAKDAGHPNAAGALAQIGPALTPADRVRVDAVLKPQPKQ